MWMVFFRKGFVTKGDSTNKLIETSRSQAKNGVITDQTTVCVYVSPADYVCEPADYEFRISRIDQQTFYR